MTSSRPTYRAPRGAGWANESHYLASVIEAAAHDLRSGKSAELVACDLEDSLVWSTDPEQCAHPFHNCLPNGDTVCRTCKTPIGDDFDPMGG